MKTEIKIRAHHLLCVLGFRGLGYSQEFVTTMGKVVEKLRSNPTFSIILVAECDIICASCPHNKGDKCLKEADSASKIKTRDLEVLHRLGFEVGSQMAAGEAWTGIKERITSEDVAELCQDCEWSELGYCAEGLEALKKQGATIDPMSELMSEGQTTTC